MRSSMTKVLRLIAAMLALGLPIAVATNVFSAAAKPTRPAHGDHVKRRGHMHKKPTRARSAAVEANLTAFAVQAATASGDPSPTNIQEVQTTRAQATQLVESGATVGDSADGARAVYLIAQDGHFVANNARRPPGVAAPTGNVMTLVIDQASGQLLDYGLHATRPDLARAGTVTQLR